jgi:hypothetical protein
MKITFSAFSLILTTAVFCQSKSDYPINPNTGLISINNVLVVKGKSRATLKDMATSYVSTKNSSAMLTESEKNYAKKMKEVPKFTGAATMTSDSLLVFGLTMKIYVSPTLLSTDRTASNDDFVEFNLLFFIKDEKIKYELTAFRHRRFEEGFEAGGGVFENENPDWKELRGKKRWRMYKDAGIARARLLAADIEKYFQSEHKGQFDF